MNGGGVMFDIGVGGFDEGVEGVCCEGCCWGLGSGLGWDWGWGCVCACGLGYTLGYGLGATVITVTSGLVWIIGCWFCGLWSFLIIGAITIVGLVPETWSLFTTEVAGFCGLIIICGGGTCVDDDDDDVNVVVVVEVKGFVVVVVVDTFGTFDVEVDDTGVDGEGEAGVGVDVDVTGFWLGLISTNFIFYPIGGNDLTVDVEVVDDVDEVVVEGWGLTVTVWSITLTVCCTTFSLDPKTLTLPVIGS